VENAIDSGFIGMDELFHEGMLNVVAFQLNKMKAYGYNRPLEPKRLRPAIIKALKYVRARRANASPNHQNPMEIDEIDGNEQYLGNFLNVLLYK